MVKSERFPSKKSPAKYGRALGNDISRFLRRGVLLLDRRGDRRGVLMPHEARR